MPSRSAHDPPAPFAVRALEGLPPFTVGCLLTVSLATLPLTALWLTPGLVTARFPYPAVGVLPLLAIALPPLALLVNAAVAGAARAARWLLGLAVCTVAAPCALLATHDPLRALAVVSATLVTLAAIAGWFGPPDPDERAPARVASGAAVGLGITLLVAVALEATPLPSGRWALAAGCAVGTAWATLRGHRRDRWLALAWVLTPLPLLPVTDGLVLAIPGLLALAGLAPVPARSVAAAEARPSIDLPIASPALVIGGSFAATGLIGAALLTLPLAGREATIGFIDALFTAFSAVCVTGLAVVDTGQALSGFGQGVVLALIQLGGLGIMTFSTAAILALGHRLGPRFENTAAEVLDTAGRAGLMARLRLILGVTAAIELIGALGLTTAFVIGGESFGSALWRGVFTSISAFCNAGFALQSTSLVPYADRPFVILLVSALIIAGAFGPVVIAGLTGHDRGVGRMAMRLIVWTTAVLLAVGFFAFVAFEWDRTLAHLDPLDRVINAFFQSVTLRTAGFNSISFDGLHPATYTVMIPLMFVGGTPGSTAGGIKVTTLAVLILLVRAAFRDRDDVEAFGFRIHGGALRKATVVSFLSVSTIVLLLFGLLATQPLSLEVALFEAVSAVGTVGLSIGGTAVLDPIGKLLVTAGMFAGRVGPLTVLLLLAARTHSPPVRGVVREVPIG